MKNFLKGSFVVAIALAALSANSSAQTVQVNGLGSSALFLELGLAASAPTSSHGLGATCVWSTATSGQVVATDISLGAGNPKTDSGNAFVAWTPGTGGCTSITTATQIYAYLQTDSVVGDRCLFNGCTIKNNGSGSNPANQISSSEVALPAMVAAALNGSAGTGLAVNVAGTDIRPEDAEFAMARALTPCGTAVATGSQYLGLGYNSDGSTPVQSFFGGTAFNVLPFVLPTSYTVTPIGATPIVVVANGFGSHVTNLTSAALAHFLDGTFSWTNQALATPAATGSATTVIIREPVSGTYNTMEYNGPNTTVLQTSQDVGLNQLTAQRDCNGTVAGPNPMNIATASGGARKRAIGTGQELSEVIANPISLGYGFWSVANFKGFTTSAAPNVRYLKVDGIDPILEPSATYTGVLPLSGTTELGDVTLANVANGSYPLWSLLRLVNVGSTAPTGVASLATAAQNFVSSGSPTSRPDFVTAPNLTVVRSHFLPPAGTIQPTAIANGHVGLSGSACTATEAGGDVGGMVLTLSADSSFCSTNSNPAGETGHRR